MPINVLMISPGYPGEMPSFTRGLAAVGARVFGVGDQPEASVPSLAREALTAYLRVPNISDDWAVVDRVCNEQRASGVRFDRIESLWEPTMVLAARLREALGVPGLTVEQTLRFRDKERMKVALDAAGIRTPWHKAARSAEAVRAAAAEVGFPLIVKPIAGAGSTDTHRVASFADLERIIPSLGHVAEVSVEEYIAGDELTFDTICAGGRILYENVAVYRLRPLEEKLDERASPSSICLRDIERPEIEAGRAFGRAVLAALGFETGFTHMEWYRRPGGEIVFGEIGARPPGARLVDAMNYASDVDLYVGWAEAVCHGRFSQTVERTYNCGILSKRAEGRGHIRHIDGIERLRHELGGALVTLDVLPVGAERRDWRRTSISDGYAIVRHPDLGATLQMLDRIDRELRIYAG